MSKRILMLRTEKGSPNGIEVCTFLKDKEYVINNRLADVFVNQMKPPAAIEVIYSNAEVKMVSEAPLNKSVSVEKVKETNAEKEPVKRRGRPRSKDK